MTVYAVLGGTGAMGAALAHRLAAAGETVWIGSRDEGKARAAAAAAQRRWPAAEILGGDLEAAARAAGMVFLTVPYSAHATTLAQVRTALLGKILVDATVPLRPPKVGTVQLPPAGSAAQEAAGLLGPDVRVVSALQNIGAEKLSGPGTLDADVLVSGDEPESVDAVRATLTKIGLRSWRAGPLANAAAAEALTSVLIQINRRHGEHQAGVRVTTRSDPAPGGVAVWPVPGLPLFEAGHDLCEAIAAALEGQLRDGDVVVVAQKVVSKVEGRGVDLRRVTPSAAADAAAVLSGKDPRMLELVHREADEVVRNAPGVVIARHRTGHVLANAGIDVSNVGPPEGETVLLWPEDPDASAERLRKGLEARLGVRLAVVISDSLGRPWRLGTTGAAIGCSGLSPLRDRRGEADLFGRTLQATVVAVADEIAAAASLVIGEAAEGLPVAIVRGAGYGRDETATARDLVRPRDQDLFR